MSRLPSVLAAGALSLLPAAPAAAALGPQARVCATGGPALLVKVSGLRNRVGKVRVRAFGGPPATYFERGRESVWIEEPLPAFGPVEVCVPAMRGGVYAVDVRHDANRNRRTDTADGAGASGNPRLSALDVILRRKPPAGAVQVRAGGGVTSVPITVRYRG